MFTKQQSDLEPVAAYDRVAPYFDAIREKSRAYCEGIDKLVLVNWPRGARSMLDVGCGAGTRVETIAARAQIEELVLLEPSCGMRKLIHARREVWSKRIEELSKCERKFDVVTCLWNVLGHVTSGEKRVLALRNMRELISPGGNLFLDVQNRYNARRYGTIKTLGRMAYDLFHPSPDNGDVAVRWETASGGVSAYGHVFTGKEVLQLFEAAELNVQKSFFVDYGTGQITSNPFAGSMLFILSR